MKCLIVEILSVISDIILDISDIIGWGGLLVTFLAYVILLGIFADVLEAKMTAILKYICRKIYFSIKKA